MPNVIHHNIPEPVFRYTDELVSPPKKKTTVLSYFGGNKVESGNDNTLEKMKTYYNAGELEDDTLVGLEVEVENIFSPPSSDNIWIKSKDGSLRNNGYEFISLPTKARYVPTALTYLKKNLYDENKPDFSVRTSLHIHVNVQDFTLEQIKSFVLLYLCFESLLYKYVGGNRSKSIFCVPLTHSGYISRLSALFNASSFREVQFNYWHKYTGLNLLPVSSLGTIEFRHLLGTDDIPKITNWLSLILALKQEASKQSVEELLKAIVELNTNSEYDIFANNIFGKTFQYLPPCNLQEEMEKDISHIKDCLLFKRDMQINTDRFENSSFFKNHKITTYPEYIEEDINNLSVEELQSMLKRLEKQYRECRSNTIREKLSHQYSKVQSRIYHIISLKGN